MYANNLQQLTNFLYFIITGIVLSNIFDIFRILRKIIKTSDLVTNIQDILFGIITGTIILLSIFLFNNGELRLYIFIGIGVGITFYMLCISKYFVKINVAIINYIKKIIILLTKPFIILFKCIKKVFLKPISFIVINIKHFTYNYFNKFKKVTKKSKKNTIKEGF